VKLNQQKIVAGRVDAHSLNQHMFSGAADLSLTLEIHGIDQGIEFMSSTKQPIDKQGFFMFEIPSITGMGVLKSSNNFTLETFYLHNGRNCILTVTSDLA
jgi:hypothetical protein